VPADWTQARLREAFARWGLPEKIRVDNGTPWGSAGDLPTDLALWLIGLGVEMVWNPPRRPQDNGVVERSQGTGKRWAEPPSCRDAAELQRRIDELDQIQRELYPSIGGKSRLEAFPGLAHSGRSYEPGSEASRWDLGPVLSHLGGYTARREVDSGGSVSLYNRNRYVAASLRGKRVYVTLDPGAAEWVVSDKDGVCYQRLNAEELTAERVVGLQVSHRRARGGRRQTPDSELPAQPQVR
jgi:transposase InsO family protein